MELAKLSSFMMSQKTLYVSMKQHLDVKDIVKCGVKISLFIIINSIDCKTIFFPWRVKENRVLTSINLWVSGVLCVYVCKI